MTIEEARKMPGSFVAYRRTDGEPILGEFGWVEEDYDCGNDGWSGPHEIEEVVMVPVPVRRFLCHELDEEGGDD